MRFLKNVFYLYLKPTRIIPGEDLKKENKSKFFRGQAHKRAAGAAFRDLPPPQAHRAVGIRMAKATAERFRV